jgi:hypothetical protein
MAMLSLDRFFLEEIASALAVRAEIYRPAVASIGLSIGEESSGCLRRRSIARRERERLHSLRGNVDVC